ncbi:MAG: competence type IV pilus major pilin ComGC [Lachnospiraceae bacterium]|jgi:prepilin-type N-terminal cleavage/methylation domain-containing protein
MFKKLKNKKAFTLMEMLIVVAIIAVLVAIAIPTFMNALEKSREATDEANIRAAYAEVMVCALTEDTTGSNPAVTKGTDGTYKAEVVAKQKKDGWQNLPSDAEKATVDIGGLEVTATKGCTWEISYNPEGAGNATITIKSAAATPTT